jgi:peptide-methionine (S)-S-oxide reductase
MPHIRSSDPERGWIHTRFQGMIPAEEMVASRKEMEKDPALKPGVRIFLEFEKGSLLDASPEGIRHLAQSWRTAPDPSRGAWRLAIVAGEPHQFGLARMFAQARGVEDDRIRVFGDRLEALAWSGILETATLGGGCFWCLEAVFRRIRGVAEVTSGYAGGHDPAPTYRAVCRGTTGHAEVVQVTFDPTRLPYAELLRIFFTLHDPTTPDRQGADVGPQYRSIILHHDQIQAAEAREVMDQVEAEGHWGAPLVTELVPFERFHPAEPEHHRYFERNPTQGYCQVVIAPKVARVRDRFRDRFLEEGG